MNPNASLKSLNLKDFFSFYAVKFQTLKTFYGCSFSNFCFFLPFSLFLSSFQGFCDKPKPLVFQQVQTPIFFATKQHFGSPSRVSCLQSWSATSPLSGMFANFFPKLKLFLHSFAFLYFSMLIYFRQATWLVGFVGVVAVW